MVESRGRRPAAGRPRPAGPPGSPGGTTVPLVRRPTTAASSDQGRSYSVLLKDSVIYGAGRTLQKLLTALMLPLFTAFMSRSDYGVIGMVVTFTTLVDVFVTLGFDVAFTRFYFDRPDRTHRDKVITHVFYVDFVYPGLLLGTLAAFMPQVAELVMGAPGYTAYFLVGIATLFFQNLSDLPFTLLRLEHRPWTFTGFTLARVLVQVPLALVLLAVFHLGPMGYLLANLLTAIALNLAALPVYVPHLRLVWDAALLREMLSFAVPAMFTALSFYLLKVSDRYFLLHFQGKAEVGLYTVANSLAQPLYIVGMAFRMAWPQWHYARLHDPERHKRLVARSATYFMAANGALLVAIGLVLPAVVHLLLRPAFWEVDATTFVLTLSVALYNLYFVFWVGANVAKKNRLIPVITLVASAVNVSLNLVLVPRYGMWAAAWTTVIGFGLLAVQVFFVSRRYYPIPYEWRRLLLVGLATAATWAATWLGGRAVGLATEAPTWPLLGRTVALLPLLGLFPLILWLGGFFTPGERARLAAAARRLAGRRPALALAGGDAAGAVAAGEVDAGVLAAEAEETVVEAEVDLAEGGSAQT